jgi:hypothetical protein
MDSPMLWFIGFLLIGLILLILSLSVRNHAHSGRESQAVMRHNDNQNIAIPNQWSELEIRNDVERLVRKHHEHPNLLNYYVTGLRTRFIDWQDTKIRDQRTRYLESLIKNLAAGKDAATLLYEFRRLPVEQSTLDERAKTEYEIERITRTNRIEAARLEQELRMKELQAKIAKQERKIENTDGKRSRDDRQMDEARDRVKRDIKWKMENQVLRNVTTLAEIQRSEREETQRILRDRSLSTEEQMERLEQLRHDIEEAKRNLNQDTNPFEDD